MAEENGSVVPSDVSQSRQRKKRKWDQPAESLVSAGVAVSGVASLGNVGSLVGISLPGSALVPGALLSSTLVASSATISPVYPVPSVVQNMTLPFPKSNQPKIQDELIIAREIVINDAEPSVRYKLTKRQTQEEIQKCTGAVVITRGKYRPPNAPPDSEKPLYLHISSAAHLKDTAERILAVDRAAAMIEEMLKLSPNLQPASAFQTATSNGVNALSTCVFLGFDADPSLNIAARIRGPNDQYINHIMNETGATVVLRGRGSGNYESQNGSEGHLSLHLFLSASNSKSLEDAKLLAENLLDTVSLESGASRVSLSKAYGAVPPPHQFIAGVQSSVNEHEAPTGQTTGLALSTTSSTSSMLTSSVTVPGVATAFPKAVSVSGGAMSCGRAPANSVGYSQPSLTGGTSYSGYGGIYPQATPLQQVAQVLRQSPSPFSSTVSPATSVASIALKPITSSISEELRPMQKRKFQELPISSKGSAKSHQESVLSKPGEHPSADLGVRNGSTMPAPKKLVQPSSNGMPPPPRRSMPPPRAPKFTSSTPAVRLHGKNNVSSRTKSDTLPDTLVKLMEYGEEDDDPEEADAESDNGNSVAVSAPKPFWAL